MTTPDIITIRVDADLAQAYSNASQEEQEKIRVQLEQVLRVILPKPRTKLQALVHELSEKAQARGMTLEIAEGR